VGVFVFSLENERNGLDKEQNSSIYAKRLPGATNKLICPS